jgi:hypothetical protein
MFETCPEYISFRRICVGIFSEILCIHIFKRGELGASLQMILADEEIIKLVKEKKVLLEDKPPGFLYFGVGGIARNYEQ